ncbi:hypothetical protein [Membranihabitans marinus]|uniref:hypothetical protein n=1 Tax=Membranihabitans marinus TaxID=1227546 RepID=UPI001F3A0B16|nr:hypothetical protein [Membranihabitans marinus]
MKNSILGLLVATSLFSYNCLFAQCQGNATQFNLDWGNYLTGTQNGWTPGQLSKTLTNIDNGIDILVTVSDPGNTLINGGTSRSPIDFPIVSKAYTGGSGSLKDNLLIAGEGIAMGDQINWITVTFSFSTPVDNLSFILYDVDANTVTETGPNRNEIFVINGKNGVNNVSPNLTGGSSVSIVGNTATGIATSSNFSGNGNLNVEFISPVDEVTIDFSIDFDPLSDVMDEDTEPGYGIMDLSYCAIALPLNLISLSAEEEKNVVLLEWKTIDLTNVHYYTVECSEDGQRYYEIGRLMTQGPDQVNTYEFTHPLDLHYQNNKLYYRVAQVQTNNKIEYSQTVEVHIDSEESSFIDQTLYRQGDAIQFNPKAKITSAQLISKTGQVLLSKDGLQGSTVNDLTIPTLIPDIYILSINHQYRYKIYVGP